MNLTRSTATLCDDSVDSVELPTELFSGGEPLPIIMAKADQIKKLIASYGRPTEFRATAMTNIDDARRKGHVARHGLRDTQLIDAEL